MGILRMILAVLKAFFTSRANLTAENVMLRQQLIALQRSVPRLKLRRTDRILLCWLSRLWTGWRSALLIVQPETVVRWHRQGFKLYWSWKSCKKSGRPKIDAEVRILIRRMSRENPTWGAPRLQSEMALLQASYSSSTSAINSAREGTHSLQQLSGPIRKSGDVYFGLHATAFCGCGT
jgi:hypothetical protein